MNRPEVRRRIGILGGTFDPIHLGHLITAQEVVLHCGLERMVFVPSARPPHKNGRPMTDARHRFEMTALGIEPHPRFELSAVELERPGTSYTVDTVKQMQALYGPEAALYFLIGTDNVHEMWTWRNPEEILDLCTVVVATRSGFEPDPADRPLTDRMRFVLTPSIEISSTEIRARVAAGKPIAYWVPPAVEHYIRTYGLYLR